jgi:ABC-2 type transport system permease protein
VSRAGSIFWFARHELRLAWRDWLWLISGRRRSGRKVALGVITIALLLHSFAWLVLHQNPDLSGPPDKRMLVLLTGAFALYGSLMLSQAIEGLVRALYGRGDLELILSSPVVAWRLFAVRMAAIAIAVAAMSLLLAAPFINTASWFGGLRWLAAYGVIAALAMLAVAAALLLTIGLFHAIGPKRTRLVAQIIAAVIGASFVIGAQTSC